MLENRDGKKLRPEIVKKRQYSHAGKKRQSKKRS